MYILYIFTTYNIFIMLTNLKGTNTDLKVFVPFYCIYPICIIYTSLFSHVFMHFHQEKFFIFIQKFTLQSIVLNWSFLLYLKSTSCAWKEVWCTNDYCTFRRNNYHLSSFDWHHRKLFVWSIQMIKRRPPQSFGRLWGFLMYKEHHTFC